MRRGLSFLLAIGAMVGAYAQQGWLPLSNAIDGVYTARMRESKASPKLHSAIRPYLREDLALLPGADTLMPQAWKPWLQKITDPKNAWHGGPLVDLVIGGSFGEKEVLKYRGGAGGWIERNAGKHWTLHADAMAWSELLPDFQDNLAARTHSSLGEGYAYRSGNGIKHYEWNAWADYKAGKYFHFTLGRGKHFVGEGERSLFISDNATSYPFFKITTSAWRIRYMNLYTMMSHPAGSSGDPSAYTKKFTTIHYLSWNALKRLNIGVFEAIVWSNGTEEYPRGFDFTYLNPVLFYRPTEYSIGSPDNALLGFAFDVKVGRRTLIYSQLMFDEFLLSNVRAGDGWYGNKQGLQLGAVSHDAFKVKGLTLRAEVDYVRPFMFTHNDSIQNYAHANQPLAHPYGSNTVEMILKAELRRGRWVLSDLFSFAVMGQDTAADDSYGNNMFLPESARPAGTNTANKNYGYFLGEPSEVVILHNEARAGWWLEPRSGLMLEAALTVRSRMPDIGEPLFTTWFRLGLVAYFRNSHPFQEARYTLPE
jgi:hypothetical protein